MGAFAFQGCQDDILTGQPSWLGNSIYERLAEDGSYTTMLRLIDDLGQHEVLSHTGSKTLFAANDEAFQKWFSKNDWGVSRYEQLSLSQKKLLLNNSMVNNAYLIEMMSNGRPQGESGAPEEGRTMRRETATSIYDSVQIMKPSQMPNTAVWAKFKDSGKSIPILKDATSAPMIHFLPNFMKLNKITVSDLDILTNHQVNDINEAWVNGKKVVERDITCKNGYIQKVDGVIESSPNMAEIIRQHPDISRWSELLDRFCAPYFDAAGTREYNRLYDNQDSVYVLRYYSNASAGGSNATTPRGETVTAMLRFDPGWNQYINSTTNSVLNYDAGAMLVPTNKALNEWWEKEGKDLQEEYGVIDNIPEATLAKLINVNMLPVFTEAVPSKFDKILNDAKRAIAAGKTEEGGLLLFRAYKGLPKYQPLIKFLSEQGMKQLMQKTENYYLQDNESQMHIVTDPLYFVISEQQHSVDMTDKGHDVLANAVSDPDFFVLPDMGTKIAEIKKDETLTAEQKQEKQDSLMEDYSLKSERVHTVIQLLKAYAMFQKDVDYIVIDNKVKIVDEQTGRIMEGRRWSDGLHQAVEAKENVKVEAATQTFATITLQNYFRMYHKLAGMTGTAETEAGEFWSIYKLDVVVIPTNRPVIRDDQDDLIYKTKKAKYAAVINKIEELRNSGRPVLVGTTDVETSELLSKLLRLRGIKHNVLNAKEHAREAEIVAQAGQSTLGQAPITGEDGVKRLEERMLGAVTIATNMAGRGTDIKLSPEVKAAGGLAIIGTERHDSRRVDRQLRGRAGRQGDPGSSEFYISLEDKLMRLFGSEKIAGVVDKLGMADDEALVNGMLSKSIENAQKKVEENNFGIRKRLLEYDDVMNYQREAVYARRRNALSGERIEIDVLNMMIDSSSIIAGRAEGMSYEDFEAYVMGQMSIDLGFDQEFYTGADADKLADSLCNHMQEVYERRMNTLAEKVYPFIKQIYEKQGQMYQNIAIPISDGRKMLTLSVNLEKAFTFVIIQ